MMKISTKGFTRSPAYAMRTGLRTRPAFTLLEILIAIALLAAIAGLLITNLDRIMGGGQREVARIFVNETVRTPLMSFRVNVGRYPTTEEGLQALVSAPEDVENWQGPYINQVPRDPWGNVYQYRSPGEHNPESYDVWSFGPDGRESDDDIGNW